MRKAIRRGGTAVLGVAVAAAGGAVYNGAQEAIQQGTDSQHEQQEAPDAAAARQDWEQRMVEAREAREAIVRRHAGCTITKVVDTHTSDIVEIPGFEKVPRNTVVITVEATTTPESAAAETKYAKGQLNASDVKLSNFESAAAASLLQQDEQNPDAQYRSAPVPAHSTMVKTSPNTETHTIIMYPRTDEDRTTSAEISLAVSAETWDPEGGIGHGATYKNVGRVSCGTAYEGVDISELEPSPITWQAAQGATEGLPEFTYEEQTCIDVPTGRSNSYTAECD